MAKLYFTYSAMNAGKSAILLQAAHNYCERGMRVMLWSTGQGAAGPDTETGQIESRIGLTATARLFRAETDLVAAISEDRPDAVFVDEAQFLTDAQVWQLAEVADDMGIPVLCYGLRTDFKGQLFEGSATLLAIADDLREARTICHCGKKATMNLRQDDAGEAVREGAQVGIAKGAYVPLCRKHFRESLGV